MTTATALLAMTAGLASAACGEDVEDATTGVHMNLWTQSGSTALGASALTLCGVRTAYFPATEDWAAEMEASVAVMRRWEQAAGLQLTYTGECAAPTYDASGTPFYAGDIRIALNWLNMPAGFPEGGTEECRRQVIAHGGSGNNPNPRASWSHFPAARQWDHVCQFNMQLATSVTAGGWRVAADGQNWDLAWNEATDLHEMGHALGMEHEFVRQDQSAGCSTIVQTGSAELTPPDPESVMYYLDLRCYTGDRRLSTYDFLGMEIAYPKSGNIPIVLADAVAYDGGWATFGLAAVAAEWRARGALAGVFGDAIWSVDGTVARAEIDGMTLSLPPETPSILSLAFSDPYARSQSGTWQVSQSPSQASAVIAASLSAL